MTTLPTRSQQTIVANIAAGIQGRASKLINFAIGATLLAIAEAFGSAMLWMQGMIGQLLLATRLATSAGPDVDSFVGDFGIVVREGASAATGLVTFARFTAGPTAPVISVGAQVQSADGTEIFQVYADPTNTAYSSMLNGYVLAASVASVNVPVECITPSPNSSSGLSGANGNVNANTITGLGTSIVGIDTVTNAAAFTNGVDEEDDTSLKARFKAAILGLSRGDLYGTDAAVGAVSPNVQIQVVEDYNYDGTYHPGYYYVVVDDGSGAPPGSFVAACDAAVQSVRPLGIQASTFAAVQTLANVVAVLTTAPGYVHNTVLAAAAAAVAAGVNGTGLGNGFQFYQLARYMLETPGVIGVTALTLNSLSGDAADITANPKNTVKIGTLVLS